MINSNLVDVVKLVDNKYVFISNDRINFISGIQEEELEDQLKKEVDVILTETVYNDIQYDQSIAFMPTLDCNLRCIYCYAKGGENKVYLDSLLACKAIDNLTKKYDEEVLTIYFVGGGEPFLNFDCMKRIVKHAKDKYSQVEITIVSNGTFGKKQLEWLLENNATIRISFDGIDHSSQRPFLSGNDSSHIVKKNIENIVKTNLSLTIQLTLTNDSIKNMTDSVHLISDLGVKYIKIEPVHFSEISRGEKNLVPRINEFIDYFIKTITFISNNSLNLKIDNSFISRPTSGYYCGAGEGSNMTITPHGLITGCLEISREQDKFSDIMIYGKCKEKGFEIMQDRRNFLDKLHVTNYIKCNNCTLKKICGGGCPMQGGWDNNDLLTPSNYNCTINKILITKLFEMIFEDNKIMDILFDNHSIKAC